RSPGADAFLDPEGGRGQQVVLTEAEGLQLKVGAAQRLGVVAVTREGVVGRQRGAGLLGEKAQPGTGATAGELLAVVGQQAPGDQLGEDGVVPLEGGEDV